MVVKKKKKTLPIAVRVNDELHKKLKKAAEEEGSTVASYIRRVLHLTLKKAA